VGNLFENLVVLEALKARYNKGLSPSLYFFRDNQGHEIELLHKQGATLFGIEIKSASTWLTSFKRSHESFHKAIQPLSKRFVIYSAQAMDLSDGTAVVSYKDTRSLFD
jgi:hypothetical protein